MITHTNTHTHTYIYMFKVADQQILENYYMPSTLY